MENDINVINKSKAGKAAEKKRERTEKKGKRKEQGEMGMIMEIISIILGIFLLGAVDYGSGGGIELPWLSYLLDIPSLVILMIFTVPVLFRGGVWKDFKRGWRLLNKNYTCRLSELRRTLDVVEMMQKQILYAGAVCLLMTIIAVLHMLSDPASLGPNLSVAILAMLYALLLEMLLLPLQLEIKRRIIDYMDIDTEEKAVPEPVVVAEDLPNKAEFKTQDSSDGKAVKMEDGQI